ncbi:glycerol-3-phosphate dehydrogenase/oxidase [Paeniglutamicibacter psychrophenolicus]|uniref:glycerol-3-phosphate dehydrogenase/oxidase n=1 Tax=Paeniglutamicibacter psychrophenolicus TaxID=257454 RepID=UPI002783C1C9|nr:glycerol-3-phosphate dehydrogenase/oxidase [Paeniglutamicibacter psychrophenolicus]MDQ0096041.1 glycerol-3-phosphate dehydrogenase [Paeniglutamicibacter psychrophenolicus]
MSARRPTWINDATRARSLEHLAGREVDVAVIGGGITGAGVALDAVSRGLSVALLESHDFGSGTSGYSSKLIHGGLRYLARGDFPVAWESAVERRRLMQDIAPHLVRPLGFIIPDTTGAPRTQTAAAGAGVLLYDALRRASGLGSSILPRPQLLSRQAVAAMAPALDTPGLRRGLLYWDGQVIDDARLVLAVVRTAAGLGAHVLRDAKATAVTASSVEAIDTRTGETLGIRARSVVNAAGVWAADFDANLELVPSRGTHLVVRAARLGNPHAAHTVAVPGHFGRYVFVLPQPEGTVYIGLTDQEDRDADGHRPAVPQHDIDFLLGVVNRVLDPPLARTDVIGTFAGLRPLVRSARANGPDGTADISRRHLVKDVPGEPITVVGGKLTTYRAMAQDAVDAAAARLGVSTPSRTRRLPLVGAADRDALAALRAPARLVAKYGTEAPVVHALAGEHPLLAEPLFEGTGITGAELFFAIRAEGATGIEDLLERRTRLSLVPADAARAAGRAAQVLALAADSPPAEGPGA